MIIQTTVDYWFVTTVSENVCESKWLYNQQWTANSWFYKQKWIVPNPEWPFFNRYPKMNDFSLRIWVTYEWSKKPKHAYGSGQNINVFKMGSGVGRKDTVQYTVTI